ncbi:family 20 glycosylhydrolase [Adhaeribacter swui]|uniref:beta-N-acetylhexosaminidase n=1 Tax=Adhaeribacter swui TaxID=2086471 RepID=A0A7G7G6T7_9BACT|nr:glycoside hydrolase family 20 zincin-like fold domain-containing protein [Adhaeribacter swui]QNF32871.1 family 20 glycosylhydrolase [Adhaeribacter swui]
MLFLLFRLPGASPAAAISLAEFSQQFRLLPQPQKVSLISGKAAPAGFVKQIFLKNATKPVLPATLKNLPLATAPGKNVLVLEITTTDKVPTNPEGYWLEIKDDQVIIAARNQAGLFYGCQTLHQLLQDAQDQKITIPACQITDFPELAYRAVHLDLKHHLDKVDYYYSYLDKLAQFKVNAVIVEFEDKLRYRKAPEVGASHAISIEEFAKISKYAQDRHIEISPLIQGLGHASFILKHEKNKKLRDDPASDWSFDPLNPETYDLQFALYEDALAATPNGKYLHIGGDEVGNLGMSELAKKSGKKPLELQMYWLNKVCEFARQHNRTPIFWDDMVFKLSDMYESTYREDLSVSAIDSIWQKNENRLNQNINLFPKNCVYMRWNYDNPWLPGNSRAIDWYKAHNLQVMAATAAQTMWPFMPRNQSNYKPIKEFCRIAAEKKMNGILCTVWDDSSPHQETGMRGLSYFALFSWNHTDIPAETADSIFRHRYFGPAVADKAYAFQDLMESAVEFWEDGLLNKGYRSKYPEKIDLIELPDATKSSEWSQKYAPKLTQAQQAITRYITIKNKIEQAEKLARRNQYTLALFKQMNELQVYPAKLLVSLRNYDQAKTAAEKKAAQQKVQQLVTNFTTLRQNYESVFSKTRLLNNPPGYVLDQNGHHHLANGTVNNDWMYVYELAMNKKLKLWISGEI